MTAAVSHLVETGQLNPAPLLKRHLTGDWGTLDQEDWNTNQRALKFGDRLLSSYDIDAGDESRLWIITEADRSSTTLLLPSDYWPRPRGDSFHSTLQGMPIPEGDRARPAPFVTCRRCT